ncbi:hypothetical protein D4Q76_02375 [archaeon]|nr:MAG: hypothetical protein D4Q76_02375 [archaeon]
MKNVICISGQPACGTSTAAKIVAEKLGLEYFSPGQYFKKHSSGKETESAIAVWKTEKGSSSKFHNDIDRLQSDVAEKGSVVIDGKLSIRMVKNADLKVWLKANIHKRAKRVAKRDSINPESALAKLKEKEDLERKNWKKIYGFDYFEQEKEADLVVDNTELSSEETAQKILEFWENKAERI